MLPIPDDDHSGVEDPPKSREDVQQKSPGWIELILQRARSHPPYNTFHWPRIILAFCVIAAGLSGLGLFVRLHSPTTDDEHEPPEFVDSSQIGSHAEILDVRVSASDAYVALLSANNFLQLRNIEEREFQDRSVEGLVPNNPEERNTTAIDFRPGYEDEFFAVYRTHGNGELWEIALENNVAQKICKLKDSKTGEYHLETNGNSSLPFLVVASNSDAAPEIYALRISPEISVNEGFCQHLKPRLNLRLSEPSMMPSAGAIDLDFNPAHGGLVFATAHSNNEIYLWQICTSDAPEPCVDDTSEHLMLLAPPWSSQENDPIYSISFNSNGTYLAVGYESGRIKLLPIENAIISDARTVEISSNSDTHIGDTIVSFDPVDPDILFSAGETGEIGTSHILRRWSTKEIEESDDLVRLLSKSIPFENNITKLQGLSSQNSNTVLIVVEQQKGLFSLVIEQFE
ncbi:MAG: WD40 repeat domain-containing protein [Leptolyngbya sp. SIO1E4]|nr:WD40 repeat domain-containing protein [Leptolyngbya sp. SIO1E4]